MGVISECSLFQGSVQRHHQMLLDAVVVVPFPSMSPGMYMGLYIDDRIPQCERIACVTRFYCPLPHGQPHAIFGGFFSISGGWVL